MCGITGFYKFNSNSLLNTKLLKNMSDKIAHRGPDYQGFYENDFVGLAHNRLSIIDLSNNANQPMFYDQFIIIFNGEIYNFNEIKQELITEGFHFKTKSDTEVILAAYKKWGVKSFSKLNGIFGFAIFDQHSKELVVVRDRFGVKPLYFTKTTDSFIFSSEIKAILASGLINKSINYKSLNEYMYFGSPMGTNTIYNEVEKVGAGEYIFIKENQFSKNKYWDIELQKTIVTSEEVAVEQIRSLLENAVKRQLISDVPVSAFLSGGLDSSAIVTYAAKHYHGRLNTYSVEFDYNRKGKSELDMARVVSARNNTIHHEVKISSENLEDVIENLAYLHDEPFADAANIPLYLLTKTLKDDIKVVLQGDGGDELFGGYSYYTHLYNSSKYYLPAVLFKYLFSWLNLNNDLFLKTKRHSYAICETDLAEKISIIISGITNYNEPLSCLSTEIQKTCNQYDPIEVIRIIGNYKHTKDKIHYLNLVDFKTILPNDYLEKVDKSTMANSVEVRVPFLDYDLADYVMSLDWKTKLKNGEKKYLLKKALNGIVPSEILNAPKKGFGVPFDEWLRSGLNKKMKEVFSDPLIIHANIFDQKVLIRKISEHEARKANHGMELWRCLNLALWYKQYMSL
jgi:asparagine synthase (glutamine-hydrolysing)